MTDYGLEFDRLVHEYNRWNRSSVRKSIEQPHWMLLTQELFFGIEYLPFYSFNLVFAVYPCFYERNDLTATQKAAVALGSDVKRIEDRIFRGEFSREKVVLDTIVNGLREKYDFFKWEYVLDCLPKEKRDLDVKLGRSVEYFGVS